MGGDDQLTSMTVTDLPVMDTCRTKNLVTAPLSEDDLHIERCMMELERLIIPEECVRPEQTIHEMETLLSLIGGNALPYEDTFE